MNRLRTRWTAWPAALLLVLSISGVAGASALISSGPAAPALEKSAVARAILAALGVENDDNEDAAQAPDEDAGTDEDADTDEDANQAPDSDDADVEDEDADDAKLPTAEELAECATDTLTEEDLLPREGESHGPYVSRIAHSDAVGPDGNHGFCVSAAARGLFEELLEETPPTAETPPTEEPEQTDEECNGLLKESLAADLSHSEFVTMVAHDKDAVGPDGNHGYCVSRAARGILEDDVTEEASDADATEECVVAKGNGKANPGRAKHGKDSDTDVEDADVDDATVSCTDDAKAKDKADKAKDKAKAEKAKNNKFEHGKRRGKGHRPF
jgi:hypothetical protein